MTNEELLEIANRERHWLTSAEFLAAVEANRVRQEPQQPRKPFVPGPYTRIYELNPHLVYRPRDKRKPEGKP